MDPIHTVDNTQWVAVEIVGRVESVTTTVKLVGSLGTLRGSRWHR